MGSKLSCVSAGRSKKYNIKKCDPPATPSKCPEGGSDDIGNKEVKSKESEEQFETCNGNKEQELNTEQCQLSEARIDFDVHPTFVKVIRTKAAKKNGVAIFGLTVLNQELFVISQHSSDIEIYDSKSLDFKRQLHIEHLFDPVSLRSCDRNQCLYIFDWKDDNQAHEILKIEPDGKVIRKWSTEKNGGYMSVSATGNVLLSGWNSSTLYEYTPDGELVGEIKLDSSIKELRLAIKLANGQFVISHGNEENSVHRVCVVDENGTTTKSIGNESGCSEGQFNGPNYFAVDRSEFIIVADQNNKRVVLLNSALEFKKELIRESDGLRYPVRLELDQRCGRMFLADNNYLLDEGEWRDGRITVFDFTLL